MGCVVNATPRPLCHWQKLVPIAQETGLAPGPVGTGAENLDRTSIRSPDSPARSETLYRLRYHYSHSLRAVVIIKLLFALRPNARRGLLIHEVSRSQTTMHQSWYNFSGQVISPPHRPLPDNTTLTRARRP
jgi:hypothetical protein